MTIPFQKGLFNHERTKFPAGAEPAHNSLVPLLEDHVDHFPISLLTEVLHDSAHCLHFVFIFRKINVFLNPGNDLSRAAILGK